MQEMGSWLAQQRRRQARKQALLVSAGGLAGLARWYFMTGAISEHVQR